MFLPLQRLAILIIISIVAVFMAMYGKVSYLLIASMISLFVLWDYIQRGTVPITMNYIYKNKFPEANKSIKFVTNIKRLNKTNRAKYFLAKGLIAHNEDDYSEANENLEKALEIPLKSDSDKAMAILALSDIAIIQKQTSKARAIFQQLKDLKVNKSLMPSIQQMQQYLKV